MSIKFRLANWKKYIDFKNTNSCFKTNSKEIFPGIQNLRATGESDWWGRVRSHGWLLPLSPHRGHFSRRSTRFLVAQFKIPMCRRSEPVIGWQWSMYESVIDFFMCRLAFNWISGGMGLDLMTWTTVLKTSCTIVCVDEISMKYSTLNSFSFYIIEFF